MGKLPLFILILFISIGFTFPHCLNNTISSKIMVLKDVFQPRMMVADSKQIYISDKHRILIFNHQKRISQPLIIGKRGEGPMEFQGSPSIQLIPEGMFLYSTNKYLILSRDGLLIEEKHISPLHLYLKKAGDNWIFNRYIFKDSRQISEFALFTQNFKKIGVFKKHIFPAGKHDSKSLNIPGQRTIFHYYKRLVYFASENDLIIDVFDSYGKKIKVINLSYKKIPVTKKDKEKMYQEYRNRRTIKKLWAYFKDIKIIYPDYFPAINDFKISDDKIYLKTYHWNNETEEYKILDLQGNLIKKVFLPMTKYDLYDFSNDTLYYIVENEDDECFELHSVKVY